jgi:adenosylcobalamin-dependent ribonucleoside-triphosphate reductase
MTNLQISDPINWPFGSLSEATFLRTYSRTKDDGSKEDWPDAVERIVAGAQQIGSGLTPEEVDVLRGLHLNFKASLAGRMLWMLGTDMVEKAGSDALVNCWVTVLRGPKDFSWAFLRHMVGGGVGFNLQHTHEFGILKLPRLTHQTGEGWSVPDTREGWAEAVERLLTCFQTGEDFTFNTDLVRPAGAPLKTFGGYASGPGVLVEGMFDIHSVLAERFGKHMRPIDAGDVANIIARVVVAGSARRSAQLLLGDASDQEFRYMKDWSRGELPYWRGQSNNTIIADTFEDIPEEYWENGWDGSGEVLGLMSLDAHQTWGRMGEYKPDPEVVGTNPCGETSLRDKDNCLLAALALPNFESVEEMKQATRVLYKVLKAVTQLPHPDPYTQEQMNRISRLGISIGGWCQATEEQLTWPEQVYDDLHAFDIEWSAERGWNQSVRLTSVKPDGTLGLLLGITPGIHGAYFAQGIRRMRIGVHDPLWKTLQARGHKVVPDQMINGTEDPTQMVVEFPMKFADNARVADTMSAVQQLDLCKFAQRVWADQSVSVTVTYRDEEIPSIRAWMEDNWHALKTVSWLRYSGHGFNLAPYEPTGLDTFYQMDAMINTSIPLIGGNELDDADCASGACPIR